MDVSNNVSRWACPAKRDGAKATVTRCGNHLLSSAQPARSSPRRRGTAEIELLLSIIVLICILMLVSAGARIGMARLNASQTVEYQALGNASTGRTPLYTEDPALSDVTTEWDDRPGLPTHTHVAHSDTQVIIFTGASNDNVPPANISALAGAISPGWTFSAYPFGNADESLTSDWFDGFISDSHPQLISPLLLAPSWAP